MKRTIALRYPFLAVCASLLALTAACDEGGVRISSSTSDSDGTRGVLKVIDALQCPDTMGSLTRKGTAQADGKVCTYSGPRGAEVSLHLVAVPEGGVDAILKAFQDRLLLDMPGTAAKMTAAASADQADAARRDAEAARADAEAARADADGARLAADAAGEQAHVSAPGLKVDAQGDRASVRMPGLHVEANGDKADVRIGGLTIHASDSGTANVRVNGDLASGNGDTVSIQAHDDAAEVTTRASGDAIRATYKMTDDTPSDAGWRMVGYEARGPRDGPIVVVTLRSKERDTDDLFNDARDLLSLNVGE